MPKESSMLLETLELAHPLIGVYDAPEPESFAPLVMPRRGHHCLFASWHDWGKGRTLRLTADRSGCPGCGYWWFGREARSREDFVTFLVDREGLKASRELMHRWLENHLPYEPRHDSIMVGPLRPEQRAFLRTVTFFVNPDQLSLLSLAAHYHHDGTGPEPVRAPFGSGCMQMLSLSPDPDVPGAVVGGLDVAMRGDLPPDILAFTVTPALFDGFERLDADSFLSKPFWKGLRKARRGS